MKQALIIGSALLALGLAACGPEPRPEPVEATSIEAIELSDLDTYNACANEDLLRTATLKNLHGLVRGYSEATVVVSERISMSDIEKEQEALDRLVRWTETIADPCVKQAYANWLEYYGKELAEARTALAEGRAGTYQAEAEKREAVVVAFAETLPKPPK